MPDTNFPDGITTGTVTADAVIAGGTAIVDAGGTASLQDVAVSGTATAGQVVSTAHLKNAGTITRQSKTNIINGAGTITTGLTATTGFVLTINNTPAVGTATPAYIGGTVLGGTAIIVTIQDFEAGTVAGTASVGWVAWGTA